MYREGEGSLSQMTFQDRPREKCGIFGAFGVPNAASVVYRGLFALQHRGQESAGIVASDSEKIRSRKGLGLLSEAIHPNELEELKGHLAIGHVRYSTTGGKRLQNIQPLVLEYSKGLVAIAHNGNVVNAYALRRECEANGSIFQTGTDSEILVHLMARPDAARREDALQGCLEQLKGAYSFLLLDKNSVTAIRDPLGFRPLCVGRLESGVVFASETCALDLVGAQYVRDVVPGEILRMDALGWHSEAMKRPEKEARCIFEHVYFARPDSNIFGENVHKVRMSLGRRLAKDQPARADIVTAVPDSGNSAALGYSQETGIPLDRGFIKNHYVGRTFIMPSTREGSVELKLNVVKDAVQGKRVVVVDDSIIRGTTCKSRFSLLRKAGAKEIHVRISAPPCQYPCYFGIDFPTRTELIAANKSVEEIRDFLEVETLGYQSVEGLLSAVSEPQHYCTACFSKEYRLEPDEPIHKLILENPLDGGV